jgi:hypothetical protein
MLPATAGMKARHHHDQNFSIEMGLNGGSANFRCEPPTSGPGSFLRQGLINFWLGSAIVLPSLWGCKGEPSHPALYFYDFCGAGDGTQGLAHSGQVLYTEAQSQCWEIYLDEPL